MGTGYQKYIDVETANKYNIPVSYTPSANAKAVAEYTVALILDTVKKITFSNNEVKNN
jgi:lactate dehydrogenase-like 2-hydroxyacid dehydrogenase